MSRKANRYKLKCKALEKQIEFLKKLIAAQDVNYDRACQTITEMARSSVKRGQCVSLEIDLNDKGVFKAPKVRLTEVSSGLPGMQFGVVRSAVIEEPIFPEPLGV